MRLVALVKFDVEYHRTGHYPRPQMSDWTTDGSFSVSSALVDTRLLILLDFIILGPTVHKFVHTYTVAGVLSSEAFYKNKVNVFLDSLIL